MHSYTADIAFDNVLSLSEDDDDEKDACAHHEHLQPSDQKQTRQPALKAMEIESKHDLNDDDAKNEPDTDDNDNDNDSENEQPHPHEHLLRVMALTPTAPSPEEDDESEEDYAQTLILDSDIAIAQMLQRQTYKRVRKLCSTDQGSVWRARAPKHLGAGAQSVVIKVASKLHYKAEATEQPRKEDILKEISLLSRINGLYRADEQFGNLGVLKGVIRVLDTPHTSEHYVAVLEDGGADLLSFITDECHVLRTAGTLTISEWQKTVKLMARRLVEVVHALHSTVRVCHGDISLENVLISNVVWIAYPDHNQRRKKRLAPDFELKLIDFGAAIDCGGHIANDDEDEKEQFASTSAVGKATYCSPQIYALQNKRSVAAFDGRATDVWSLGVCLFILAVGNPPWTKPDDFFFATIVLGRDLDYVLKAWSRSQFVEDALKELLLNIFVIDEAQRISTTDIMHCEWLTGN